MTAATSGRGAGARGGAITVVGQGLKALIQLLSVVVLSRLLGPEDFGLIAMVTVAVAFGELVLDFGLTAAALRSTRLTQAQASNLFWLNVGLGVSLGVALALGGPALAALYSEPRIAVIAPVIGLSLVFRGLQAQLQVHLARNHRFTAIAVTDVASQALAFVGAVVAAMAGLGFWALVIQVVVLAGSLFLLRVATARWVPSLPRRGVGSGPLVRDGANYAVSQVLTFAAGNVDTFVIGVRWDSQVLGYYNRAFQLLTLPLSRLLTPLTSVAVPMLTRTRDSAGDVVRLLSRIQTVIVLPVAVLFALAAGSADALVPVLLGDNWTPAVSLFQILAVGGALRALAHVNYWMFLVLAPSRELLRLNAVTKSLTVGLVVVAATVSVEAVAVAYAFSLLLSWPINLAWLKKVAKTPVRPFLLPGLRYLIVSLPIAAAGWLTGLLVEADLLVSLFLQVAAGLAVAMAAVAAVPALRADLRIVAETGRLIFKG